MTHGTNTEAHSPLGASGAYRWMVCPGSVGLSFGLDDDESEFAAYGTAGHWIGETALRSGRQAWSYVGQDAPNGVKIDPELTNAVDLYLSFLRKTYPDMAEAIAAHTCGVEQRFHCPDLHEFFYGTADFWYLWAQRRHLDITDYKNGVGVIVGVEDNVQMKYYACGIVNSLGLWDKVDNITVRVVQPRGFHPDGPVREWSLSVDNLRGWLLGDLIPAMDRTFVSTELKSGDHCRFCAVRFADCPQLSTDVDEFEAMSKEMAPLVALGKSDADKEEGKKLTRFALDTAAKMPSERIARYLELLELTKIATNAAWKTAFGRLNAGGTVPGWKLAQGSTHRIFKRGFEDAAEAEFGDAAWAEPKWKSPAEIDKLPKGKAFTKRWAFKPPGSMTVVKASSLKPGISVDTKSMFQPVEKG